MNVSIAMLLGALLVAGILLPMGQPAAAAFRPEINYQGKLTDTNNLAVPDGSYYMTFRLYATSTGGTPLWTEAHVGTTTPVAVTNGLFTVMLGSINPLSGVDFNQPLWLEVAIGGTNGASWEVLSPRKPLGAVPAAFVADTLDGVDSSQFLRSDTSDTFGGGTLTIDGSGALSVLGSATFSNATSTSFYTTTLGVGSDYLTDLTGTGLAVQGGALSVTNVPASSLSLPHGFIFRGGPSGTAEATSTVYVADNGWVGIGTTNPSSLLDVSGGMHVASLGIGVLPPGTSGKLSFVGGAYLDGSQTVGAGQNDLEIKAPDYLILTGGYRTFIGGGGGGGTSGGITFFAPIDVGSGHTVHIRGPEASNIGLLFTQQSGATADFIQFKDAGGSVVGRFKVGGGAYFAGNVGVDTQNPAAKLHIYGTTEDVSPTTHGLFVLGDVAGLNLAMDGNEIMARNNGAVSTLYLQNDGGGVTLGGASPVTLNVNNGGFVVTPSRLVGIGTTNPAALLHLDSGNGDAFMIFQQSSESSAWSVGLADYNPGQELFIISRGMTLQASPALTITTLNRVGIGTTSPQGRLHVSGTTYLEGFAYTQRLLDFDNSAYYLDPANTTNSLLVAGRVGIRTTNPNAVVEVAGSNADLVLGNATQSRLRLLAGYNDGYAYLQAGTSSTDTSAKLRISRYKTATSPLADLQIYTNQAYFSGRVGIGVTAPTEALEIAGGNLKFSSEGKGIMSLQGRLILFQSGGNTYLRLAGSPPARILIGDVQPAVVGIATGGGRVGVGTSSPWGRLSVQGLGTSTGKALVVADANNTPRFVVQDDGKVGIGTSSPQQATLEVSDGNTPYTQPDVLIDSTFSTLYIRERGSWYGPSVVLEGTNPSRSGGIYSFTKGDSTEWYFGKAFSADAFTINQKPTGLHNRDVAATTYSKFWITATGDVGIGTTSPEAKLDVVGSLILPNLGLGGPNTTGSGLYIRDANGVARLTLYRASGDAVRLSNYGGNDMYFDIYGNKKLAVVDIAEANKYLFVVDTASNRVGVNTATPTETLEVSGNIKTSIGSSGNLILGAPSAETLRLGYEGGLGARLRVGGGFSRLYVTGAGVNSGLFVRAGSAQTSDIFQVQAYDATPYVAVTNGGQVGIGTSSPTTLLEVEGSSASTYPLVSVRQSGSGDAALQFIRPGVQAYTIGIDASDGNKFKISKGIGLGSVADLLVIERNVGNVGVGTANPTEKLEVYSGNIRIRPPDNATSQYLKIDGVYGTGDAVKLAIKDATFGAFVGSVTNTPFRVVGHGNQADRAELFLNRDFIAIAGGSERMRITTAGDVVIGTTTPLGRLTVAGTTFDNIVITASNPNAINGLRIWHMFPGGRDWRVEQGRSAAGEFNITDCSAGCVQRLVIDTAGNVGIGTTSPFEKLSVAGNIYADGFLTASSLTATSSFTLAADTISDLTGTGLAVQGGALSVTNVPASSLSLPHGYIFRGGPSGTAEATSTVYVADDGRVGVGTTNPVTKLDVYDSFDNAAITANKAGLRVKVAFSPTSSVATFGGGSIFQVDINTPAGVTLTANDHHLAAVRPNIRKFGVGTTTDVVVVGGGWHWINEGHIQTFYQFFVPRLSQNGGTGTVGTAYGLYITALKQPFISNTFGIYQAGASERNYFAGSIGIGTTNPGAPLQVIGTAQDANGGTLILGSTGGSNLRLGYHTAYSWIQSHGSKPLAINPIGNYVGIGTTNPTELLDVRGRLVFPLTGDTTRGLLLGDQVTPTIAGNRAYVTTRGGVSHMLYLSGGKDGGGARGAVVLQESGGNVGIGTTTPSVPLHVAGSATLEQDAVRLTLRSSTTDESGRPGIVFANNQLGFFAGDDHSNQIFGLYSTFSNNRRNDAIVRIFGSAANSWNTYLQLMHDGTNGSIATDVGDLSLNPAGNVIVQDRLFVRDNSGIGGAPTITLALGDNDTGLEWVSDGNLAIYTNNVERVRVTSGGNVGIGTTSPSEMLSVSGNARIAGGTLKLGPYDFRLIAGQHFLGFYANPTSNYETQFAFHNSGGNPVLYINKVNGLEVLRNGVSYAEIGNTQGNTIIKSGNLGIGTTSPAQKLHISGNTRTDGEFQSVVANNGGLTVYATGGGNLGYNIRTAAGGGWAWRFVDCTAASPCNTYFRVDYSSGNTYTKGNLYPGGSGIQSSVYLTASGGAMGLMGGNVGVGTTAPSEKLEVAGYVKAKGFKTSAITGGIVPVYVRGTGLNHNAATLVKVGDTTVYSGGARGLTLCVLDAATHASQGCATYDTYGSTTASNNLASALNDLRRDQIGILASHDAWELNVTQALRDAARRLGLFKLGAYSSGGMRRPYAAIFYGSGTTTANTQPAHQAIEVMESNDAGAPYALLATWLTEDGFIHPGLPNALVSADASQLEPAVIVNSAGNVGIGTTNPAYTLDVNGTTRITDNGANVVVGGVGCGAGYVGIAFSSSPSCSNYSLLGNGTNTFINRVSGGTIYFRESNNTQVVIAPGGNVGIGTTGPAAKLDVAGNIKLSGYLYWDWSNRRIDQVAPDGTSRYIRFMNSGTNPDASNPDGGFAFTDQSGNILMRIKQGKVGVGTSTPWGRLSVSGSVSGSDKVLVVADSSESPILVAQENKNVGIGDVPGGYRLKVVRSAGSIPALFTQFTGGTSGTAYTVAQFDVSGSGAQSPAISISSNGTKGLTFSHTGYFTRAFIDHNYNAATALAFGLRGVEYMRLTSDGNLGIGTTNPAAKLHIKGGGLLIPAGNYWVDGGSGTITGLAFEDSAGNVDWSLGTDGTGGEYLYLSSRSPSNTRLDIFQAEHSGGAVAFLNDVRIGKNVFDAVGNARLNVAGSAAIGTNYVTSNPPANGLIVEGSVGIGTSAPSSIAGQQLVLDVNGYAGIGGLRLNGSDISNTIYSEQTSLGITTNGGPIYLGTGAGQKHLAVVGGNIGIGTTNPGAKLHVYQTTNAPIAIFRAPIDAWTVWEPGSGDIWRWQATTGSLFGIYNQTDNLWRLVVDTNGNVGIGTTAPSEKLEVAGNIKASGSLLGSILYVGPMKTQTIEQSGTGDLTIPLGRFRIGTAVRIEAHISGPWSEVGGTYVLAGNWASTPVVLEQRVSANLNDRLRFYGYVDPNSNGYAYLFATWDNQSPGGTEVNTVRLRITGYDFNTSTTGNFASSTQLAVVEKSFSDGRIFYQNGTLTLDTAAQRVGIRTTSPNHPFDIDDGSGNQIFYVNTDGTAQLSNAAGNWSKLTLKHIESLPGQNLMLNYYTSQGVNIGANGGGGTRSNLTLYGSLYVYDSVGNVDFLLQPDGVSYLNGGNVGIGTASPAQALHVVGNVRLQGGFLEWTNGDPTIKSAWDVMKIVVDTDSNVANDAFVVSHNGDPGTEAIRFNLQSGNSFINVPGNLGIGTTNPTTKLTVVSGGATPSAPDANAFLQVVGPTHAGIAIESDDGTGYSFIHFGRSANMQAGKIDYYHGDDSFRFFTAGTEKLRITASGNVGIGTTNPTTKLTVVGSGRFESSGGAIILNAPDGGMELESGNDNYTYIDMKGNNTVNTDFAGRIAYSDGGGAGTGAMIFYASSSERMRITEGGNVGIGTTNPAERLHVVGSVRITDYIDLYSNNAWRIAPGGDAGAANTTFTIRNYSTMSSPIFAITAGGNVGIGTVSPTAPLHVEKNLGSAPVAKIINTSGGNGEGLWIETADGNGVGDALKVVTFRNVSPQTMLRIPNYKAGDSKVLLAESGGKVGIGLSNPVYTLDVNGSIRMPYGQPFKVGLTTWANNTLFTTGWDSSINQDYVYFYTVGNGAGNANVKITLLSNGNIGIGTTTPSARLHIVGGDVRLDAGVQIDFQDETGDKVYWWSNTYGTGIESGTLTHWAASRFRWRIGGTSVSAGTEKMTLTSTGLKIGGGDAAYPLDVTGDAQVSGSFYVSNIVTDGGSLQLSGSGWGMSFSIDTDNNSADAYTFFGNGSEIMRLTDTGLLGIGTTSPVATLSVAGSIFASSTATSTFLGSLEVDRGRIAHDYVSGETSIANLNVGSLQFEANAGWVSWFDLPVVSGVGVDTPQAYTARIDGQDILTVWARASDASGLVDRTRVVIGSASASVLRSANIPSGSLIIANGALCVDDGGAANCDDAGRIAGRIYAESTSIGAIDLAENFPVDPAAAAKPEAGELVAVATREAPVCQQVRQDGSGLVCVATTTAPVPFVARATSSEALLGVVSTEPGVLLGGFGGEKLVAYEQVPVALAGRVPVVVNAEGGSIRPGDYITLSSQPGVGTKATTSGYVVGRALTGWEVGTSTPPTATSSVLVFVEPRYAFVAPHFAITAAGIGIGTSSPAYPLHIVRSDGGGVAGFTDANGTCVVAPTSGGLLCSSDKRLKQDITALDAEDLLNRLLQIRPVAFRWNNEATSSPRHLGFLAQEVQEVFPALVRTLPDETLSLNYNGFIPLLVAAVQEHERTLAPLREAFASSTVLADLAALSKGDSSQSIPQWFSEAVRRVIAANLGWLRQQLGVAPAAKTPALQGGSQPLRGVTLLDEVTGEPYCLRVRNGAVVATAGACGANVGQSNNEGTDEAGDLAAAAAGGESEEEADTQPPTLQVVGNNPAVVPVGARYRDLGVIVSDNVSHNIGYKVFVDGKEVEQVRIDTSQPARYRITYEATDAAGNVGRAFREVIVVAEEEDQAASEAAEGGASDAAVSGNTSSGDGQDAGESEGEAQGGDASSGGESGSPATGEGAITQPEATGGAGGNQEAVDMPAADGEAESSDEAVLMGGEAGNGADDDAAGAVASGEEGNTAEEE